MNASPTPHLICDDAARCATLLQELSALGDIRVFSDCDEFVQYAQRHPPDGPVIEAIANRGDAVAMYRAMNDAGIVLEVTQVIFDDEIVVGMETVQSSSVTAGDIWMIGKAIRVMMDQPRGEMSRGDEVRRLRARALKLTQREAEVMSRVVQGFMNKQTADQLGLSPKTVEVHRAHVMEKMQASSLAQLVRMAVILEQAGAGYSVVTMAGNPKKPVSKAMSPAVDSTANGS